MEWFFGIIVLGIICVLKMMMNILSHLPPNFLMYQMTVCLFIGGCLLSNMEMVMSYHRSFLMSGPEILLFMSVL